MGQDSTHSKQIVEHNLIINGRLSMRKDQDNYGQDPFCGIAHMANGRATVGNRNVTEKTYPVLQCIGDSNHFGNVYVESRTKGEGFVIRSTNFLDSRDVFWFLIEAT